MITLSVQAERYVSPERLHNLQTRRAHHRAQLAEAKAALTLPELADWRHEAHAAVDVLEVKVAHEDEMIERADKAAAALNDAVAVELEAIAAVKRAEETFNLGSLDRKETLRLRDDVDLARSIARVRFREREAAARLLQSLTPQNASVPALPSGDVVESIARLAKRKHMAQFERSRDYTPIERERWTVMLETPESQLAFVPVWIKLELSKLADERNSTGKIRTPHGYIADPRREDVTPSDKAFLEEMRRFKEARVAHIHSKAARAQADLEAAQSRVAALGAAS